LFVVIVTVPFIVIAAVDVARNNNEDGINVENGDVGRGFENLRNF
jgi:hypothetical protein